MLEEPATSETAAGSRVGSRFGHYLLLRLLGRGGFGEVYAAEDTEMDRVVALKLIAAPYSQNRVFRQRLNREARTAGRLHEPHVVPVHHCGEIDGQLYIDMRLIEGADLQAVLARDGPLSPERAVAIVGHIAAALDAAHAGKVIHRDVKPANILLTGDDFAYLVDFGLANAAADAKLTSSGTTIGTFAYMAPERLGDAVVSAGADIYALACVLYECLTGATPYATGDLPALITAHLTAPIPRPSWRRPQIPASFDHVIARGMAKNPDDRYSSAGELARAARRALTMPDQDRTDPAARSTQAAALPAADQAATIEAAAGRDDRLGSAPTKRREIAKPQAKAPAASSGPPAHDSASAVATSRSVAITLAAVVAAMIVSVVVAVSVTRGLPRPAQVERAFSPPSQTTRYPQPSQVELPFANLRSPTGVAVDAAGNVYVTDVDRVLKLLPGSNDTVELPLTGLVGPKGLALDTAGNIYITDWPIDAPHGPAPDPPSRVLKVPTGSTTPVQLPFSGVNIPDTLADGVAVDAAGNVYVADGESVFRDDNAIHRVLKLPAGASDSVELPFVGLQMPIGVAVDAVGNVYVLDIGTNFRVLKLLAGPGTQVELPVVGLHDPRGVAVDTAGNVYVTDNTESGRGRVLKLPAGSGVQVELPFTGLKGGLGGVAVDTAGNIYVTEGLLNIPGRVLKLQVR